MQGARSDVYVAMDDMLVDGDLTYDMDYLNIPIYAKYYVYDGFYLFAGPQFGFNVQSSVNADAIDFEGSGEDMDIKDIQHRNRCRVSVRHGIECLSQLQHRSD